MLAGVPLGLPPLPQPGGYGSMDAWSRDLVSALHSAFSSLSSPVMSGLASLDGSLGLVEQWGPASFRKRPMGLGDASYVLRRSDGDARYTDDFIQFLPGAGGAVARSIRSKLRDTVSLLDLGVIAGDLSAGNGAKIRAAMQTAAAEQFELVFPAGEWRLDNVPTVAGQSYFIWRGQPGAVLSKLGGSFAQIDCTDCTNFALLDLPIDGRGGESRLTLTNCQDWAIDRCHLTDTRGWRLLDGTARGSITNCQSLVPLCFCEFGDGPSASHAPVTDILLAWNRIIGSKGEGLEFSRNPERIWVMFNEFLDCGQVQQQEVWDVGGGNTRDLWFINNYIENLGNYYPNNILRAIFLKTAFGIDPERVHLINNRVVLASTEPTAAGINIDGVQDYEVIGGSIECAVPNNISIGGAAWGTIDRTRMLLATSSSLLVSGSGSQCTATNIYCEPDAAGRSVLINSGCKGSFHGRFVGGARGVDVNAESVRVSGDFEDITVTAVRLLATGDYSSVDAAQMINCEQAVQMEGDRQRVTGLTAVGSGTFGVRTAGTATNANVGPITVTGYTNNWTDAGAGTVTSGLMVV